MDMSGQYDHKYPYRLEREIAARHAGRKAAPRSETSHAGSV